MTIIIISIIIIIISIIIIIINGCREPICSGCELALSTPFGQTYALAVSLAVASRARAFGVSAFSSPHAVLQETPLADSSTLFLRRNLPLEYALPLPFS